MTGPVPGISHVSEWPLGGEADPPGPKGDACGGPGRPGRVSAPGKCPRRPPGRPGGRRGGGGFRGSRSVRLTAGRRAGRGPRRPWFLPGLRQNPGACRADPAGVALRRWSSHGSAVGPGRAPFAAKVRKDRGRVLDDARRRIPRRAGRDRRAIGHVGPGPSLGGCPRGGRVLSRPKTHICLRRGRPRRSALGPSTNFRTGGPGVAWWPRSSSRDLKTAPSAPGSAPSGEAAVRRGPSVGSTSRRRCPPGRGARVGCPRSARRGGPDGPAGAGDAPLGGPSGPALAAAADR